MAETISKVEKTDIEAPIIEAGGTAIVFQRHEKYDRTKDVETTGSITPEGAMDTKARDLEFFSEILGHDDDGETMVLIVSSDTQYGGKGRRSMETAQLAQDAAVEAMNELGIDPNERIINFNSSFRTKGLEATGQAIRPMGGIVEPKMFDENPEFVRELGRRFNPAELQEDIEARRTDVQLSPRAFAMYEEDIPEVEEMREQFGVDGKPVEGVHDIVDRTKDSLAILERYARMFHARNPGKRLVIWASSHYDTISPLVKEVTAQGFDAYVPVDYGAGVVIEVPPKEKGGETTLKAQGIRVALELGKKAFDEIVT